jgi:hypothetical protein
MKPATMALSVLGRWRVQGGVRGLRQHVPWALACAAVALVGCGRSQLEFAPAAMAPAVDAPVAVELPPAAPDAIVERGPDLAPDLPIERAPDLAIEMEPPPPPPPPPPVDAGPVCHPQPETCNGIDDDCNGKIDDGLPAIPCPNGGERYCISGAYSECPRRCEVCVPGSQVECFTAYCTYWGTQTCASDGRSWGGCKESLVPAGCGAVTDSAKYTADIEKCCLAQGLCCLDTWNLDNDPTTTMIGRCDSVMCGP